MSCSLETLRLGNKRPASIPLSYSFKDVLVIKSNNLLMEILTRPTNGQRISLIDRIPTNEPYPTIPRFFHARTPS